MRNNSPNSHTNLRTIRMRKENIHGNIRIDSTVYAPVGEIQKLRLMVLIVTVAGVCIKTTLDTAMAEHYGSLISSLTSLARSSIHDLDSTNDLTFIRIRSKKHEIMVAPGQYSCIVLSLL